MEKRKKEDSTYQTGKMKLVYVLILNGSVFESTFLFM